MKKQKKLLKVSMIVLASIAALSLSYYLGFLNYMGPTKIGIARNHITGKMWPQDGGGIFISPPWIWVTRIDTRPIRVSVPSGGRGYSAKLVQFEKRGWQEFIAVEGWHFYWWSNRFSVNFGYPRSDEHRGMKDILRGYAYGAKKYSFLTIIQEYYAK